MQNGRPLYTKHAAGTCTSRPTQSLAKCLSSYNNARWRGNALRVARAKQSPLVKLLEEIESERQQQTCAGPLSQGQPTSAQKRRFLGYSRISALIRSRGVPVEPYMDTRLNRDEKSDQGSRREAESEDEEGEVDEATFIRNYRRTLAESGLPRKAVRSAVRALEEADAIEVVKPGAGGRGAQEQHQDSPTTSTGDVDESSETGACFYMRATPAAPKPQPLAGRPPLG